MRFRAFRCERVKRHYLEKKKMLDTWYRHCTPEMVSVAGFSEKFGHQQTESSAGGEMARISRVESVQRWRRYEGRD